MGNPNHPDDQYNYHQNSNGALDYGSGWDFRPKTPTPLSYDAQQDANIHAMGNILMDRDKSILGQQAPTLRDNSWEFNQTNDSRNLQLGALEQQRQAALGNGPSLAQVQNQHAMGQGFSGLGAQMGAGGGNLLAQRQAMLGGNQMLGQAAQQGAGARGQEIYGAMGQYGQGAAGLRQGDVGAQHAAMTQIAAQRALQLNQAKANTGLVQGYEDLDMGAAGVYSKLAQQAHANNLTAGLDQQKQSASAVGTTAATVAALYAAMMMAA